MIAALVGVGSVLKVIASHDPVDLISRPPGLDELFLGFYRGSTEGEASRAP